MTEKVCQLYEEEQTGKLREGRKAVPSSKMPDLGWDIAETQLQKDQKFRGSPGIIRNQHPTDNSASPSNDCNSHLINNNTKNPQFIHSRNSKNYARKVA